jgi:hypothetical protein
MPISAASLIAIVGLILALAVFMKTRRIGPTIGVVVAAFIVMAITDTSLITTGGQKVGAGISWALDNLLNF